MLRTTPIEDMKTTSKVEPALSRGPHKNWFRSGEKEKPSKRSIFAQQIDNSESFDAGIGNPVGGIELDMTCYCTEQLF